MTALLHDDTLGIEDL